MILKISIEVVSHFYVIPGEGGAASQENQTIVTLKILILSLSKEGDFWPF
jgi:hypothetical protein